MPTIWTIGYEQATVASVVSAPSLTPPLVSLPQAASDHAIVEYARVARRRPSKVPNPLCRLCTYVPMTDAALARWPATAAR